MSDYIRDEVVEIDQNKLKRMVVRIFKLERDNTKNNKLSDREIKAEIQNIIEEEANKCY